LTLGAQKRYDFVILFPGYMIKNFRIICKNLKIWGNPATSKSAFFLDQLQT